MKKRLVVCADGTWNTPDQKTDGEYHPTNVVKMARGILPTAPDGTAQPVFYDAGVGTSGGFLARILGGAFGAGLKKNVQDGYRFLIHNYEPGDEIYLFGFSRGAYTVRSLAGLIRNCGILKKSHAEEFERAFALYRSEIKPDDDQAQAFVSAHSHRPDVYFIGVWDTVGALGIPIGIFKNRNLKKYQFHDVRLSSTVKHAYHALALDEKRHLFAPTLWQTKTGADQTVEQVWFPGVHSDVGGGYPDPALSNIPLLWLLDKAAACGLAFDADFVQKEFIGNAAGILHNSRTGLYKLFSPHLRRLGTATAAGEQLHDAIKQRMQTVPAYRPQNYLNFQETSQSDSTTSN